MKYYILGSGSKGNCTVIKSAQATIVIDCGLGKNYTFNKFDEINVDNIDGLLITHEHNDHIKQINSFKNVDIYSPFSISLKHFLIKPLEIFKIKDLTILPIPLSHDVPIVVGYIIFDGKETLVSITDTGYVSSSNEKLIQNAHYYIFESNYDVDMLMASDRTQYLKQRIISDCGHMDNKDSADVLSRVIGNKTKEIVLAHISSECNKPEIAYNTLVHKLKEKEIDYRNIKIAVASQNEMYEGGQNG